MIHRATPEFWSAFAFLPEEVRLQARKQFTLLQANPRHPSVQFKKVGRYWSARVNRDVRALAVRDEATLIWFWIGSHTAYDRINSGNG